MNSEKGSTTIIATGTVISILMTILTATLAYTFKDKVDSIATMGNSVNVLETKVIPDLTTRTALNEKDITYIKQGVDDIKEILKTKR